MRALVVHIGEGSTHILLATTRRLDQLEYAGRQRRTLFDGLPAPMDEQNRHNRLYVMHDQQVRNGADLSLRYLGKVGADLRETLLHQAADAVHRFRDLSEGLTVAISAGLLAEPALAGEDSLVAEFQRQMGLTLHVLSPADEALWVLRGVRGIYPSGELSCVQTGHWRSLGAWEVPGRVPLLTAWDAGCSRPPEESPTFAGLGAPTGQPLYVTGEHAWLTGALHIGLTFHDMDLLDETVLADEDLERLETLMLDLSERERDLIPMTNQQGDCLPEAIRLMRRLLRQAGAPHLRVCSRGLAHGLASHLFFEGRRRGMSAREAPPR